MAGTDSLSDIRGYRRLADDLITSGQPTAEQLSAVAEAGFQDVINLALHNDSYSLPDERATVEGLGMSYTHIPIFWQQPAPADLAAFFAAMDRLRGRRIYVHCAANMRVSAFMYLYRVLRLGWPSEAALPDLYAIWQPDETWQSFIHSALVGSTDPSTPT
jgi:protein tyrosine phosphatase (PTP) superfamily phosphohydrolase (DUF442 family)